MYSVRDSVQNHHCLLKTVKCYYWILLHRSTLFLQCIDLILEEAYILVSILVSTAFTTPSNVVFLIHSDGDLLIDEYYQMLIIIEAHSDWGAM